MRPEIVSVLSAIERRVNAIAAGPAIPADFAALVEERSSAGVNDVERSDIIADRRGLDRIVRVTAAAERIDPDLLSAVIASESGFDPNATSPAGARGLMQLMPQTAASLGVADAYDPVQNVRGGSEYLRSLLDRFGSVELAVAAYNAGPAAVERYGGIPPFAETQNYVRAVLGRYRELHVQRNVRSRS
jgi:soluble lytic murein transglycosylase-like protein